MPMSEYMRELRAKVGNQLLEVPAAGVVAFDDSGRVLLVRHSEGGLWTTPGGAIEPRESPADAALREAWEETGAHLELSRIIGVYGGPEFVVLYENGDLTSYLMVVFEARLVGGQLEPDGEETLEVGCFSREELGQLALPDWLPPILEDAFDPATATHYREPRWKADTTG